MRILIVTSQFPIADEPNRGRPLHQTIRELACLATVRVASPVAVYPRWARPLTYLSRPPRPAGVDPDIDAAHVGYPALPLASRPFNGWSCARALRAECQRFRPDLVLSYWMYPDAFGAMLVARRAGLPLVAGARGSDLRVRDPVSRMLTRPVVAAAERLLVVSEDLGRIAVGDYGADGRRVRVIGNGCNAHLFRLCERPAARADLRVPPSARLVLYVGRLVAAKGLHELLEAMAALSPSVHGLHLALLGEGPLEAALRRRIAALPGLQVTLAGAQPPETVARWMAAADVVTLPSHSEGHPNVLVEAMACGRPVVATRVGGIPEVVDRSSGILVPPHDPPALRRGLAQALARQWDEESISRRFSRDWRRVAEETLDACREALHSHAVRRAVPRLPPGRRDPGTEGR